MPVRRPSRRQPSAGPASTRELVRLLHSAFAGPAWHGPSLRASLRGVTVDEARWQPSPERNSIWQLVLHAAYGKHRVACRLDPVRATRFPRPLARAWWPRVGEPMTAESWERDRELLDDSHDRLVAAIEAAPAGRLEQSRRGTSFTLRDEAFGCALHDVYHAGQVRLLVRLRGEARA